MYTQTIENYPMKDKTNLVSIMVSNVAISALSAFLVIAGIIMSVTLSVILLPFLLINLYLIKRRFNHMMHSRSESDQSSTFAQDDIIEGEFTVSEEMVRKPKEP